MLSLYIPDLTEQGCKLVVVHSPGREHLGVVVVERPELGQTAEQSSEVLRLVRMMQGTKLPEHVQHGLLESLNRQLVLYIRPLCKNVRVNYTLRLPQVLLGAFVSHFHRLTWC